MGWGSCAFLVMGLGLLGCLSNWFSSVGANFWSVALGGLSVQGGLRVGSETGCSIHNCFEFSLCSAVRSAKPTRSPAAASVARVHIHRKKNTCP